MKKRRWLIAAAAVLLLCVLYCVASGFVKTGSVYISDFAPSDDGTEMTLKVFSSSSAGYVRKLAVYQEHGGRLYLDCYGAFGGVNGSLGARSEFTVPLAADTEIIAIYRNHDCYEEVLRKDADGIWQRVR